MSKGIEAYLKHFPTKKLQDVIGKFYQIAKKQIIAALYRFFQRVKNKEYAPTYSVRPV